MAMSNEYARVHHAAKKIIGKTCMICGATGKIHAALHPNTDKTKLLLDPINGCYYSPDPTDYYALCPLCHKKIDSPTHCRKGHPFTPENTHVRSNGARRCRICNARGQAKRMSDPVKRARARELERGRKKPPTPEQHARRIEMQRIRRARAKANATS